RFLEVARSASRELGVNWFGANSGGNPGFSTGAVGLSSTTVRGGEPGGRPGIGAGGPGTFVDASGNPVPAPGSPTGAGAPGIPIFTTAATLLSGGAPFGVALANLASNSVSLDLLLTALETKGLIRQLAEPDLIA